MRYSTQERRWWGRLAWVAATAGMMVGAAQLAPRAAVGVRQDASAPSISTLSGVYSTAQATRGEETYMTVCVACHPSANFTTQAFKTAWNGRPLSDFFDLVKDKMPKNDPGSLTPGEYAQSVAYLLKINDLPAGEQELPADGEALKKIRIEMPAGQ